MRVFAALVVLLVLVAVVHGAEKRGTKNNWKLLNTNGVPPSPRAAMVGLAFDKTIYTFGGFRENQDPNNPIENEFYNDVFKFHTPNKRWTKMTPTPDPVHGVPAPRTYSIVGRHKKEMIVGFGITYTSSFDQLETFNDLWAYNTNTNSWRMIQPNHNTNGPSERADPTAAVYNGKIYLFGGVNNQFGTETDTWVYDIDTDVWTQLTGLPATPSGRYTTFNALDKDYHRMWMYGGERSVFSQDGLAFEFAGPDALWYLDLDSLTWVPVAPFATVPNRTNGNGAIWYDGLLMFFGGDILGGPHCDNVFFDQNNTNETWSFNSHTKTWHELCPATRPPNFKRATSVLVDDTIYMFGGFAFNSATCGPFILNQDVYTFEIDGCVGGNPCGDLSQ